MKHSLTSKIFKVTHFTLKNSITSSFIGIAFGVLSFISSQTYLESHFPDLTEKFLLSFAIFIAPIIISLSLSIQLTSRELKKGIGGSVENLNSSIKSFGAKSSDEIRRHKGLHDYGPADEVGPYISKRISSARNVRNTCVGLRCHWKEKHITNAIADWVENQNSKEWMDICGIEDFFSGRYQDVRKIKKAVGEHTCYVLKHSTPIMNFVILKDSITQPDEVFWGWKSGDTSGKSNIFGSRDQSVIRFFEEYFLELLGQTWNREVGSKSANGFSIDYSINGKERAFGKEIGLVNKVGRWVTFSYTKRNAPRGKFVRNRFGIVDIKAQDGELLLSTMIFDGNGKKEEAYTKQQSISHYMNNVFVEYKLEGSNFKGICHYKFIHEKKLIL